MAEVVRGHARDFIHPQPFGACPIFCIKAPDKQQKLADIVEVLKKASTTHPVLFVDEADIDFNPRIGAD